MNVSKIAMPVVNAQPEIKSLNQCTMYLVRAKGSGIMHTIMRANNEVLFFDENDNITFLTSKAGNIDMEFITDNYDIIRKYNKGETLSITA